VGTGPAGLSAAWRLTESGRRVVLYDRRSVPGGLMRSDVVDGAVVDVGAQMFASTYRSSMRLAGAVGLGSLLVRSPGRDALWRAGRAHTISYGSAASMATSTALPALLKLRLVSKYLPFLARRCRSLDANDPAGTGGAALDDESISDWGSRELGRDFVELMAYPFLSAYHGGVPERTSAAFYHALARVGMDVELYGMMGGTGRLAFGVVDALEARGGEFVGGRAVRAVEFDARGVMVRLEGGEEAEHDAVVVATPAAEARSLVATVPELGAWLDRVEAAPFVSVAVVTDRPVRTKWFGLAVPRIESPGDRLVAACVEATKAPGIVPEGSGLIVAFPSPAKVAGLLEGPPERTPPEVLPALDRLLGSVSGMAKVVKVYRHVEGHTQFYPGYIRHLLRFREEWLPGRVALAGDYLVAPTIEGAVISGERAAVRIGQFLLGQRP